MTAQRPKAHPVSMHEMINQLLDHAGQALRDPSRDADHTRDDVGRLEGAVIALTSLRDLAPLPIDLQAIHPCDLTELAIDGTRSRAHSDAAIRSNATELTDALDVLADLLHPSSCTTRGRTGSAEPASCSS